MSRRNQGAYIDRAERYIDEAWQRLPVFKRDRSTALLSLVTITDDYLRWKFLSQPSDTSLMTLRVAQEALEFAVPWVYATCVNDNRPVPRTITEEQCLEGKALMEYAEAYNYAVMAFTNYHAGLYTAKADRGRPRIVFDFVSEDESLAETEKRAYEMTHASDLPYGISITEEQIDSINRLGKTVTARSHREPGDRVGFCWDEETVRAMRDVRDLELAIRRWHVPDSQAFSGIRYEDIKRYLTALAAISWAQHLLHVSNAIGGIQGGAVSSVAVRLPLPELNSRLSDVGELELGIVAAVSKLLTYDGSQPKLDCVTQPLLAANDTEVIVPGANARGAASERNLLKLYAKHPALKVEYDRFSAQKEQIALPRLIAALKDKSYFERAQQAIKVDGRKLTDVDVLAYDPACQFLLIVQHKWLIEPDTMNESRATDEQLRKGIRQGEVCKQHLSDAGYRKAIGFEKSVSRVEAIVVCRGLEPTGFVKEVAVPVVTEDWFLRTLSAVSSLEQVYGLAVQRPDRKQVASEWSEAPRLFHIAGYTLVVPGLRCPIKQ